MLGNDRGLPAMTTGEITIRARYAETDRMGLVHHANYLVWFEMGRIELLRSAGQAYRDLEDQGYLMVLTRVQVRYHKPALYDDLARAHADHVRGDGQNGGGYENRRVPSAPHAGTAVGRALRMRT